MTLSSCFVLNNSSESLIVTVPLSEIVEFLQSSISEVTGSKAVLIHKPASISSATAGDISFVTSSSERGASYVASSKAAVLLVPSNLKVDGSDDKTLLFVDVPRLRFAQMVNHFFVKKMAAGIHPSAVIHASSKISSSAFIGPNVVIDQNCVVGEDCVIHANVHLYENTRLGRNVTINSSSSIGQDGFGYERLDSGEVFKFPHLGGVVLEDDVEIGACACIDRGTLDDTIIRRGARVDNLVHVAHNCEVGEHSYLISQCHLGGSVKVGKECWVSPLGAIRNGASIGDRVMVGMMSLVTKPIGDDVTLAGSPAQPLREFITQQKAIKSMVKNDKSQ